MDLFLKTLEGGEFHREVRSIHDLKAVINKAFFAMTLEAEKEKRLNVKVKKVDIGPLNLVASHTSCPIIGVRRYDDIKSDINQDHCLIYLPVKMGGSGGGQSWHYQGGRQARGGERVITIIEGNREYRVHRPTFLGLTMVVPYSLLQSRIPRICDYCVTAHDATQGPFALAWDFIMSVWYNHSTLSEQTKLHYANSIIDLLVIALTTEGNTACVDGTVSKEAYLQRALDYIDAHISSATITPETIAENLGIKKRYLYEIFNHHEKSLGTLIRDKRLERCLETLCDKSMENLSITEVAYRWGFASYTHFSRVFKEKYQISPREFRQRQLRQAS